MFEPDPEPTPPSRWWSEEWCPDSVEHMEAMIVEYRKRGWRCRKIDYEKLELEVIIEWDKRPDYAYKMVPIGKPTEI